MELIRGLHNVRARHAGCVLTIGAFDGLHLGHQALIRCVLERSRTLGAPSAVLSFEPTPREYFARSAPPARLTRFREKVDALQEFGIERFVCARFNEALRRMEPDAFVREVLVNALGVKHIVVGHDFKFAKNSAGRVDTLRSAGATFGFEVTEVPPFELDGERVSSSKVREALAAGDMPRAATLLGRPYRMTGKVVHGGKLGRQLGFPTANLRMHRRVPPLAGVFAVRVHGAGLQAADAVANLGTRPVVNGAEPLLEVHVFDFEGDLYRQYLHVDFIARLRDEQSFASLDALVAQMREDAVQARAALAGDQRTADGGR
jgi:riboflavin kinase/FMN adenylyltransferase